MGLIFASKDLERQLNELGFERMLTLVRLKKKIPFHHVSSNLVLHIQITNQGKAHERLFGTVLAEHGTFILDYGRKDLSKAIKALQGHIEKAEAR